MKHGLRLTIDFDLHWTAGVKRSGSDDELQQRQPSVGFMLKENFLTHWSNSVVLENIEVQLW